MSLPLQLTTHTSADLTTSDRSDMPAPKPAASMDKDMADLAVISAQLIPTTHVTQPTAFDTDDQPPSLATNSPTNTTSDVVRIAEAPRGFFDLPRELRDEIYKLLDQNVKQSMWYGLEDYGFQKLLHRPPRGCDVLYDCYEEEKDNNYRRELHCWCEHHENFERYDLETTVSITLLRLVNKKFKQEYDESYDVSNDRLKISLSPGASVFYLDELQLPSISKRSTKLDLDFVFLDTVQNPGCVWCGIKLGETTHMFTTGLGTLERLLDQLPNVGSIHADLLGIVTNKRRFLGCPPELGHCPGFECWRDGFADPTQLRDFSRRLLPEFPQGFIEPSSRSPDDRLAPTLELCIHIGKDPGCPKMM